MKTRFLSVLVLSVTGVVTSADPAMATPNLFTPISGNAFRAYNPAHDAPHLTSVGTMLVNTDPTFAHSTRASLGHAQGGLNGFTFYGINNGGGFNCSVWVVRASDGVLQNLYEGWSFANGPFSFFIQTNPPPGNYFYSAFCTIPNRPSGAPLAGIVGVKPDH